MNFEDTRSFSPQTQQALRKRAVAAVVEQGRKQGQLAQDLGVTRPAVNRGVQRYRARGEKALAARKQARPSQPQLARDQVATTTRLIRNYAPEQLQLPYALWTREAVGQLIEQQWGVQLSQSAVVATCATGGCLLRSQPNELGNSLSRPSGSGECIKIQRCTGEPSRKGPKSIGVMRWDCARTTRLAPAGRLRERRQ